MTRPAGGWPNQRARRVLRWYPPEWRQRYGDELLALVEDLGPRRLRLATSFDLARAGVAVRLRALGVLGADEPPCRRAVGGLAGVIAAWALVVLAGGGFAKFSEHWEDWAPAGAHRIATDTHAGVVFAALCGAALIVLGAGAAAPAAFRALRRDGPGVLRRPLLAVAWSTTSFTITALALIAWAHRLTPTARNGADAPYSAAAVSLAILFAAVLAAWATLAVAVAHRAELSVRILRIEWAAAMGVAACVAAMVAFVLAWWAAVAAPTAFATARRAPLAPSPWALQMVASTSLLAVALAGAIWGCARTGRAVTPRRPAR